MILPALGDEVGQLGSRHLGRAIVEIEAGLGQPTAVDCRRLGLGNGIADDLGEA
jgi:hypothetical protein